MTIEEMYNGGRKIDAFILARFYYRIGEDENAISDKQYTEWEDYMKQNNLAEEYLNRTYDDDPIPIDLLKEIGNLDLVPDMTVNSKYASYLDEDKSLSIRAVRDSDSVWEFVQDTDNEDLIISIKADGVNGKKIYIKDLLELCLSRARDGNGFDYTKNIAKVIPTKLHTGTEELKIFSESFVLEEYLPVLRKLSPNQYKTPKSSAISLLRRTHEDRHYRYLVNLAFNVEGAPNVKTIEDKFIFLREQGFRTVPFLVIKREHIPKERELFDEWLFKICEAFYNKTKRIKSDGLVLEVNNLHWESKATNQYLDRNIAIKMYHWDSTKYMGVVEGMVIEQQRVLASCRIQIRPMLTRDLCTATYINAYNPDIIMREGINIGTPVMFERDSGAINKLLYGKNLDAIS